VVVPAPGGPCAATEAPGSRSASMIAVTSADRPSIPGRAGERSSLAPRSRAATERISMSRHHFVPARRAKGRDGD
jgi:hypothetical protein